MGRSPPPHGSRKTATPRTEKARGKTIPTGFVHSIIAVADLMIGRRVSPRCGGPFNASSVLCFVSFSLFSGPQGPESVLCSVLFFVWCGPPRSRSVPWFVRPFASCPAMIAVADLTHRRQLSAPHSVGSESLSRACPANSHLATRHQPMLHPRTWPSHGSDWNSPQ